MFFLAIRFFLDRLVLEPTAAAPPTAAAARVRRTPPRALPPPPPRANGRAHRGGRRPAGWRTPSRPSRWRRGVRRPRPARVSVPPPTGSLAPPSRWRLSALPIPFSSLPPTAIGHPTIPRAEFARPHGRRRRRRRRRRRCHSGRHTRRRCRRRCRSRSAVRPQAAAVSIQYGGATADGRASAAAGGAAADGRAPAAAAGAAANGRAPSASGDRHPRGAASANGSEGEVSRAPAAASHPPPSRFPRWS